jgi:hypothetical protein
VAVLKRLKLLQAGPEGYTRVWRDLLSIFRFLGPEMEPHIDYLAWDWWLKEYHALRSAPVEVLRTIDNRIENSLGWLTKSYGLIDPSWRRCFRREIGSTGELGMWHLRLAVETRLPSYRDLAAEGKLLESNPLELAIQDLEASLQELDMQFERNLAAERS